MPEQPSRYTPPLPLAIGWAGTSITPDKPVQLHGQFHERVSRSVHDPCTATALALETTGPDGAHEQAVLVSCDLVAVERGVVERLRTDLSSRLPDFDARKLSVNATHTHTGPTMMDGAYPPPAPGVITPGEYAEFFIGQLSDCVVEAWRGRKPGGVSWALGHAAIGFNRRTAYADGTSRMYGPSNDPLFEGMEGGMDPGVDILFCCDASGSLTGVVINIACPSQVVESEYFVSADLWHPTRERLREIFSPGLFVYPMCSSAGDQSPRDLVRRGRGEPDMRREAGMNELGRRLANAVEDAFKTAQSPAVREVVFAHHVEELSLPMRKVTAEEAEQARRMAAELSQKPGLDPGSSDSRLIRRCHQTVERLEKQGPDPRYSFDLHALRLDEIAICTNPFELFLDYGLQIKGRSRAHQTFVVQLASDRGAYLPTPRAVARGSYGAMVADNTVGPEGGHVLVERTVELLNALWAEGQ